MLQQQLFNTNTISSLFFYASKAVQTHENVDVYICGSGRDAKLALVSDVVDGDTFFQKGAVFVGNLVDANVQQLTNKNELTQAGAAYCSIYGVAPNVLSLKKWTMIHEKSSQYLALTNCILGA